MQGQTVKALLSVSLRGVRNGEYLFCHNPTCAVVYYSADQQEVFTTDHVRERVYQKHPDDDAVFVCYCFRHTAGQIRVADSHTRAAILKDINMGIQTDQCACDLRNPQGSCCLGNVRALIARLEDKSRVE